MKTIDLDHLREWVGKIHNDRDVASSRHARLMAATLDVDPAPLIGGAPLPPLWHWSYFLEGVRSSELGRDGHPLRGGFLPPVPLPNRMWAGGRVRFEREVPLDAIIDKRSTISRVDHKRGRTGDLVFVTVTHEILVQEALAIYEEHDIVYKEASQSSAVKPAAPFAGATWTRDFQPTSTTLFRYSALTFNGHRIHYDSDYCRSVEGYESLVIHGPLSATLLAGMAEQAVKPRRLRRFDYRCLQPALLGQRLTMNAVQEGERIALCALLPDGSPAVVGTAHG